MAKYNSTIQYNIKTTLDTSGLTKLQGEMHKVQGELKRLNSLKLIDDKQFSQAMTKINQLSTALNKSFNSQLGMINFNTLKKELTQAGVSANDIGKSFRAAGSVGDQAFNSLVGRLGKIDTGLQSVSKTTDKLFNTIGNTVRWGIVASGFQSILNSAHQAVQYMKDLDKSLTNIRMVTDYSKEDMREFALYANEAAKSLGSTTTAYTNAALIFAQQGFNLEDSTKLGEYSIKLANVTGQDTATTSNQLTSYMNAYGTDLESIGLSLDKWAEVANVSAADVKELSVATQKAGSTAATVGVNMDQLAAQIATIESVTRDAPENIGNGLKTIYARFSDLSLGETLEDGMDLGKVSSTLEGLGVEVINKETGVMNDVGDIIEQLMGTWDNLDQGQKAAAANALAGKYQMNRLMALMENSDMYETFKGASEGADGTLEVMNSEYLESLEGRFNSLKASVEGALTGLFNQDSIGPFISGLSEIIDKFTQFTEAVGGGSAMLTALGATATRVFSDQIGRGLTSLVANVNAVRAQTLNANQGAAILNSLGLNTAKGQQDNSLLKFAQFGATNANSMSQQQQEQYNKMLQVSVELKNKELQLQEQFEASVNATNATYRMLGFTEDLIIKNQQTGLTNLSKLSQVLSDSTNKINKTQFIEVAKNLEMIDEKALIAGQAITKLSEQVKRADFSADDFTNSLIKTQESLNSLTKGTGLTKENISHLQKALDLVEKEFIETGQNSQILRDQVAKLCSEIIKYQNLTAKAAANPQGSVFNSAKAASEAQARVVRAEQDTSQQKQLNTGFVQTINTQQLVSGITSAVGAIGQLAFAWQSFQALGSIWANEDLELGEKVSQTIMNVGMSMPMLIMSLTSILELRKTLLVATGAQNIAEAASNVIKTLHRKILATEIKQRYQLAGAQSTNLHLLNAETVAKNIAIAGNKSLASSLASVVTTYVKLNPMLLAGAAAFAVICAAVGAYNQRLKEQREANKTALESSNELIQNFESQKDSFNSLYDEFKATGEISDEFRDATLNVAETLGIMNAELYISTQQYDKLKEKIDEATISQYNYNASAAEARNRDIASEREEDYKDFQNDPDLKKYVVGEETAYRGNRGQRYTSIDTEMTIVNLSEGKTELEEQNKKLTDQKQLLEANLNLLEAGTQEYKDAEDEIKSLNEQIDSNTRQIQTIESTFTEEDLELLENRQNIFKNTLQGELISGEYEDLTSYEEVKEQLLKNVTFSEEYYRILNKNGENAAEEWLLGWASEIATYEGDKELTDSINKDFTENLFSSQVSQKISEDDSFLEQAEQAAKDQGKRLPVGWQDTIGSEVAQNLIDQINNATSLSEDQKIELMAGIDWEKSIPEINATIQEAISSGKINPAKLKVGFDEKGILEASEYSDGEIESILEDTDISSSQLDAMSEKIRADSVALKEYDEVVRSVNQSVKETAAAEEEAKKVFEEESKTHKEGSKEYENAKQTYEEAATTAAAAAKQQKKLKKESKGSAEAAKQLAAASIRASKGVAKLSETIEDDAKALKKGSQALKKGKTASLEYYQALENTRAAMGEILGLENADLLSDDFLTNVTNLENMQKLAEGNADALDALRIAAGKDIVANININSEFPEEARDKLMTAVEGLATSLPPLNVPVDINTNPYMQSLNEMLAAGEITAKDANDILSSIGYDPSITMVSGPVTTTKTTGDFTVGTTEDDNIPHITIPYENTIKTQVKVPKITDARSTGGGSSFINYNTGAGSGSGSGRKSSSGGSGGSGKGGSGKSKKDKQKKDKQKKELIEKEEDLYKKVNHQLEAISNKYEKISNEADRLTGKDRQKAWQKELDLLDQQIDKLKEKQRIQRREMEGTANKPNSGLRDRLKNNYGLKFGPDGEMLNYNARRNALVAQANAAIKRYNANNSEANERAVKQAEDRLEAFDKAVDRYETLWADMQETDQEIEDAADAAEDLRVEILQAAAEAADSIKELNESLDDLEGRLTGFSLGDMDDPFVGMHTSADKLIDYLDRSFVNDLQGVMPGIDIWGPNMDYDSVDGKGHGRLTDAANYAAFVQQEMDKQARGEKNVFGENSAAALEEMKSAMERLNEEMNNAMDAWVEMQEQILAAEEKLAEQVEERQEQYEAIGEQLEYQKEVTELIYGEQAYAILDQIYNAQEQNNQAMIQEQRMQIEQLQAALANLRAQGDTESELYKQMEDRLRDAQSNLQDLITNSLEVIREEYEKTIESILETWSSGALGGNDLDWMETEWELIERNSEQYLDNVNAAYETQKLQNKYIELLDNETNLHNQQLITQQMNEQLGYLREKDKLSEYDVAYANAQLEILQKRIALEEAQQNKSQMKLKRDTQGNYSYVYAADEANMAAAQSDLLDAENNAYNLSKDNMIEMQNNSMSALKDAYSLIQDIWTNANLTLEEKSDRTQKVVDALKEYLAGAAEQLSTSEENLINDFLGMTESLTDENSARLSDVFTELVGGNNDALTQIDERFRGSIVDWLKNLESFNNDCDELIDELVGNVEEMEADIADVADAAEEDFSQISNSINECAEATDNLNNSTQSFFETLSDQTGIMLRYQEGLMKTKDDLAILMEEYNAQMEDMQKDIDRLERQNADYRAALGLDKDGNPVGSNPPSGNPTGGDGKIKLGEKVTAKGTGDWYYSSDGLRPTGDVIAGEYYITNIALGNAYPYHLSKGKTLGDRDKGWVKKNQIEGYDTGGYTGSWNNGDPAAKNGKLAYLHQKELVLNETDTKNLLAAIEMVRTLTDQVKNSNIAQAVSAISGKIGVQSAGDTIEQRVSIEANFPNVKDATEIEQALLNLSDQAYQWAYRYR